MDYYVPLFFVEISLIQPEVLCKEVNLCQKFALISTQIREDCCGVCHHAVSEVLTKLKDPDTQVCITPSFLKLHVSSSFYLTNNWISLIPVLLSCFAKI